MEKEKLEKDKLTREKKGKNAYDKWLILAQNNRYYSQVSTYVSMIES